MKQTTNAEFTAWFNSGFRMDKTKQTHGKSPAEQTPCASLPNRHARSKASASPPVAEEFKCSCPPEAYWLGFDSSMGSCAKPKNKPQASTLMHAMLQLDGDRQPKQASAAVSNPPPTKNGDNIKRQMKCSKGSMSSVFEPHRESQVSLMQHA